VSFTVQWESDAVVIVTAGGAYTSISGLWQSQYPSIWSLRHGVSCICYWHTPGALYVEQMAVYECKQLGDSKLRSTMCCESISWSPTLADDRKVLEHSYAAKQHLIHSIWGTHKWDLERGILKQQPKLNTTRLNHYQVRVQVDQVRSHFIHTVWDSMAELYNLHRF